MGKRWRSPDLAPESSVSLAASAPSPTSSYVYTSFKNAQNYSTVKEDQTLYLLVGAQAGANLAALKQALHQNVPDVDVYTNHEMCRKTQAYWVFKTGAGITTLMGSVRGLLVGMDVVAHTIYAATVDHIREFGTLKAMGARNSYIYRVIIEQSLISAVLGYIAAISIAYFVVRSSAGGNAVILLPPQMAAGTLGLAC